MQPRQVLSRHTHGVLRLRALPTTARRGFGVVVVRAPPPSPPPSPPGRRRRCPCRALSTTPRARYLPSDQDPAPTPDAERDGDSPPDHLAGAGLTEEDLAAWQQSSALWKVYRQSAQERVDNHNISSSSNSSNSSSSNSNNNSSNINAPPPVAAQQSEIRAEDAEVKEERREEEEEEEEEETGPSLVRRVGAPASYRQHEAVKSYQVFGARSNLQKYGKFAFAFDIDGVLMRSGNVFDGARVVLKTLLKLHIPFVLLTNSGGLTEVHRAAHLSRQLGVPLRAEQVIQSHTPLRQLAEGRADYWIVNRIPQYDPAARPKSGPGQQQQQQQAPKPWGRDSMVGPMSPLLETAAGPNPGTVSRQYFFHRNPHPRDANVLVIGKDAHHLREVAQNYGFRNVIIPADILRAFPNIFPFNPMLGLLYKQVAHHLPRPPPASRFALSERNIPEGGVKIDAILVFNDPLDWALEIQLISDLLMSDSGILGTVSPFNGVAHLPNRGFQMNGQPLLVFSNPDVQWSAAYHLPRLGQGAFRAALAGVWSKLTGNLPLKSYCLGKPYKYVFKCADDALMAQWERKAAAQPYPPPSPPPPPSRHGAAAEASMRATGGESSGGGGGDGSGSGDSNVNAASDVAGNGASGSRPSPTHATTTTPPPLSNKKWPLVVYMVGDNPDSDIMGANRFISQHNNVWRPLLVRTGVYKTSTWIGGDLKDARKPVTIVDDVLAAVQHAFRHEERRIEAQMARQMRSRAGGGGGQRPPPYAAEPQQQQGEAHQAAGAEPGEAPAAGVEGGGQQTRGADDNNNSPEDLEAEERFSDSMHRWEIEMRHDDISEEDPEALGKENIPPLETEETEDVLDAPGARVQEDVILEYLETLDQHTMDEPPSPEGQEKMDEPLSPEGQEKVDQSRQR